MKINRLSKSLAVLLGVLTLAACSSQPASEGLEPGGELSGPIVGPRWNLLLVGTHERLSLPESAHFVIARDGSVSGSDGCNPLRGEVRLGERQRIEFQDFATTRRSCPEAEDAERVREMLETAYRYLIDHDRLVFFGPNQRVLGGFRRAS
ncbi:META domain-containing protein [Halomonas sp. TRM85114]|uniref:META domain-containing protein n=1 Tax=Halomonas jincaotanensis TaxID=2810616 RepID=UPI001BD2FFD9|nr:META domain-containing protein [Halomonas jincaotanensis]MBS9403784.1 META domain-containing protein [Halomonas jincaotanensis]